MSLFIVVAQMTLIIAILKISVIKDEVWILIKKCLSQLQIISKLISIIVIW